MPYVEIKNGEHYCSLCWKDATEGHFSSAKHQRKVAWWVQHEGPRYGLVPGEASSTPAQIQQPNAEVRDIIALETEPWIILRSRGGDDVPYCTLCNKFAEEEHLLSSMHQTRRKYPQCYGYNAASPPAPPQGPTSDFPPPPQGPPPEPKPVYYSSPSVCPPSVCPPPQDTTTWSQVFSVPPPGRMEFSVPPPLPPKASQLLLSQCPPLKSENLIWV